MIIHCPADVDHPGVVEHHGEALVPQQEPQEALVAPGLQVAGGEVVAEAVHAAVANDPGPLLQPLHHAGDRLGGQPFPL